MLNDKVRSLTNVDMFSGGLEAACSSSEGELTLSKIFKIDIPVRALNFCSSSGDSAKEFHALHWKGGGGNSHP